MVNMPSANFTSMFDSSIPGSSAVISYSLSFSAMSTAGVARRLRQNRERMARRRTGRGQEAGASPTETHRASDRIRDGDLRAATARLAHARLLFLRIWRVFFEKLQP